MASDATIDGLLRIWKKQGDYLRRLLGNLSEKDMVNQPVPGVIMNHAAWTMAHLRPYPDVMTAIVQGKPFEDPKSNKWWMGSTPSGRVEDYPPLKDLAAGYLASRERLAEALSKADASVLTRPTPLERWKAEYPRVADVLLHLMVEHECGHIGQISAWRRACGMPGV